MNYRVVTLTHIVTHIVYLRRRINATHVQLYRYSSQNGLGEMNTRRKNTHKHFCRFWSPGTHISYCLRSFTSWQFFIFLPGCSSLPLTCMSAPHRNFQREKCWKFYCSIVSNNNTFHFEICMSASFEAKNSTMFDGLALCSISINCSEAKEPNLIAFQWLHSWQTAFSIVFH